jgi:transcription initiation factor IIE alpha subunit
MNNIKTLKKLVDDNAISFMRANDKEYEAQYNMFIKFNSTDIKVLVDKQKYLFGIDLSNSKDKTGYSPHKTQ